MIETQGARTPVAVDDEHVPVLVLTGRAMSARSWIREFWQYRAIVVRLARADFQARYKRATLGMLWAVGLPLIQAAVIAVVFAKLVGIRGGTGFPAYVLVGVTAWSYFSAVFTRGATAIVDGSAMTDKVWFSRAVLPTSPVLSNLPGLGVTTVAVLVLMVPLGAHYGMHLFLLIPATFVLILFAWSLALFTAAMHVYFRDIRFLVQAVMLLWFYVTPLAYPTSALGPLAKYLPYNPATGVISLFHLAVMGQEPHWRLSLLVTAITIVVLTVASLEIYRRRDRVLVDLL